MNKYEAYVLSRAFPLDRYRERHRYPIYTYKEVLELAAELPGLQRSVEERRGWITSIGRGWYFEASPTGILAHRYDTGDNI